MEPHPFVRELTSMQIFNSLINLTSSAKFTACVPLNFTNEMLLHEFRPNKQSLQFTECIVFALDWLNLMCKKHWENNLNSGTMQLLQIKATFKY